LADPSASAERKQRKIKRHGGSINSVSSGEKRGNNGGSKKLYCLFSSQMAKMAKAASAALKAAMAGGGGGGLGENSAAAKRVIEAYPVSKMASCWQCWRQLAA